MLYTPRSYKLFLKIMFTLQVRGDTIEWIFPPRVHHSQHMRRTSPIWANPFWSSAVDSTKYLWNNCFMFTCCLVCSDIMLVHFVAQSVFFFVWFCIYYTGSWVKFSCRIWLKVTLLRHISIHNLLNWQIYGLTESSLQVSWVVYYSNVVSTHSDCSRAFSGI